MARQQAPHYVCHLCGSRIIDYESVANFEYDYLRSTATFPTDVAICWGCFTGDAP